jgi:hypothetical protein
VQLAEGSQVFPSLLALPPLFYFLSVGSLLHKRASSFLSFSLSLVVVVVLVACVSCFLLSGE